MAKQFRFDAAKQEIFESADGVTWVSVAKATAREARAFLTLAAKKHGTSVIDLHETTRQSMATAPIWKPVPGWKSPQKHAERLQEHQKSQITVADAMKTFSMDERTAKLFVEAASVNGVSGYDAAVNTFFESLKGAKR